MRDIITVAKNELRNLFNNKGTILTVVIIPLITVLLSAILSFTMTQEMIAQQIDFTADGYVINAPDIYKADLEKLGVVEADADELEKELYHDRAQTCTTQRNGNLVCSSSDGQIQGCR